MSAAVSLAGIVKRHGSVTALAGIDLEVAPGEFFSLLGPSGSGKTTTLRILAGLERADAGTVHMNGRDITALDPGERDVAMVFQSYALYPHMTVRENMGFSLKLRKENAQKIAEGVDRAARILNLVPYLERYPRELSGGQRQRVAMGRAIVRDPKVFLFDEPLSNLDAKLRVSMRAQLSRLHERLGVTTVYVTHDQVEAMTLGQRVAVMRGGVLQQCDTPEQLFDHPANLFVAAFIGSPAMNLVEAHGEGGEARFGSCRLPSAFDGRFVLGIRPHDLRLGGQQKCLRQQGQRKEHRTALRGIHGQLLKGAWSRIGYQPVEEAVGWVSDASAMEDSGSGRRPNLLVCTGQLRSLRIKLQRSANVLRL